MTVIKDICPHGFEKYLKCGFCSWEDGTGYTITVNVNDPASKMKIIYKKRLLIKKQLYKIAPTDGVTDES